MACDNLSDTLKAVSKKLGVQVSTLRFSNGGIVDDIGLIRYGKGEIIIYCFCRDDDAFVAEIVSGTLVFVTLHIFICLI